MTTSTQAPTIKTDRCKLTHANGCVTVTSEQTSKSVTLHDAVAHSLPKSLRDKLYDYDLVDALDVVELTHDEMRLVTSLGVKTVDVIDNTCNVVAEETIARSVGYNGRGIPLHLPGETNEERLVRRGVIGVSKCNEPMSMLIYDIPTAKASECPNPSPWMWRFGFRLNLSCWVLPESSLSSPRVQQELAHWQQHRIEVHVIPYAEHALAKIREIAAEKLRQEVIRAHTSLIERIASADERYKAAVLEAEQIQSMSGADNAEKVRDSVVRGIVNAAGKALNNAIACAEKFDVTMEVSDLLGALRAATRAQAETFNLVARAKQIKLAQMV